MSRLLPLFAALSLAAPVCAQAEELPFPVEIPAETPADDAATATPGDAGSSTPDATAPVDEQPFDASGETFPWQGLPQTGAAAEPELQPPSIDAWFDIAFTDTSVDSLGYREKPGGYRFIVAFRLEDVGAGRFSIAPEIGYFRIGSIDEDTLVSRRNPPGFPNYLQTQTTRSSLDATSLDFGIRLGRDIGPRAEAFARLGAGFYHLATEEQVTFSYTPLPPETNPIPDDIRPTSSATSSGVGPYGAVGIAVRLGEVPSLYVEYGVRLLDGDPADSLALGLVLNF